MDPRQPDRGYPLCMKEAADEHIERDEYGPARADNRPAYAQKALRLAAPAAGARNAVVVSFGRPMNYTLLQGMMNVAGPGGDVAGAIDVVHDESEWRFTPQQAWTVGSYRLIVDTSLEDVAGNKIC